MKILFITDNFPPEVNAPAKRTYEHSKHFRSFGADVDILTCAPNFPEGKVFPGYKNSLYTKEIVDGLTVHRVFTFIAKNTGFVKRLLDFVSFAISAFIAGLFIKTDIVVSTSPQFFTCFAGYALAKIKRKPWILEIRDLWPESVFILDEKSLPYQIFYFFEYFFYRRADHLIVVTESFKETIKGKGISGENITVVFNGSDFTEVKPDQKLAEEIKEKNNLKDKFVLGYVGTFGMSQNLDFYISLADKIKNISDNIVFLLVGAGAEEEKLRTLINDLNAKNVLILPKVSQEQVPSWLSVIDVSLVPLRNIVQFKKVIPSKIFENAALQIPILLGVDGEVKNIVEKYELGKAFIPDDENSFLENLKLFYNKKIELNPDYSEFYLNFDRKILAGKMFEIFEKHNKSK
ncbi:MAG: glycosyltransferase WbuB [Melioribacteraceae bacterium]|nr:MAG: glycosyltransferase WbuB [Melioribacteraceae bacterium]